MRGWEATRAEYCNSDDIRTMCVGNYQLSILRLFDMGIYLWTSWVPICLVGKGLGSYCQGLGFDFHPHNNKLSPCGLQVGKKKLVNFISLFHIITSFYARIKASEIWETILELVFQPKYLWLCFFMENQAEKQMLLVLSFYFGLNLTYLNLLRSPNKCKLDPILFVSDDILSSSPNMNRQMD